MDFSPMIRAYDADGYLFGSFNEREETGTLTDIDGREQRFTDYESWEAAVLREGGFF